MWGHNANGYDWVGSRAVGGPNTRSDIDFRIDSAHPAAFDLVDELRAVSNGAGSASLRYAYNFRGTKPPFMRFHPKSEG